MRCAARGRRRRARHARGGVRDTRIEETARRDVSAAVDVLAEAALPGAERGTGPRRRPQPACRPPRQILQPATRPARGLLDRALEPPGFEGDLGPERCGRVAAGPAPPKPPAADRALKRERRGSSGASSRARGAPARGGGAPRGRGCAGGARRRRRAYGAGSRRLRRRGGYGLLPDDERASHQRSAADPVEQRRLASRRKGT